MPKIEYIGRLSLHFYGKYLSEIVRNLKNRGRGRVVVKETEVNKFSEPCFYILREVVPLMSDKNNVRCRAYGERIFRGKQLGDILILNTHEPDWRLLSIKESSDIIGTYQNNNSVAPDIHVNCVADIPPLLSIYLHRYSYISDNENKQLEVNGEKRCTNNALNSEKSSLLLTPHQQEDTVFKVAIEPTDVEKTRIYPPYSWGSRNGLITKPPERDSYLIRRSDTPGLYWRVHLSTKMNSKNSQRKL